MSTNGHQNKHIAAALDEAADRQWRIVKSGSKAKIWGRMYCPYGHPECAVSIFSTPRVPEYHARHLMRVLNRCPGPKKPEFELAGQER